MQTGSLSVLILCSSKQRQDGVRWGAGIWVAVCMWLDGRRENGEKECAKKGVFSG